MSFASQPDALLIDRVRQRDAEAWSELIGRFEGRLLAYVESRTRNRAASEDLVQETFIGFLTSLPNFDSRRPLEGYLFSIAAHKLTDYLRREGRRPALPLVSPRDATSSSEPMGNARPASSIARSGERRHLEEASLVEALGAQIDYFRRQGQWERLECAELLLVRGWPNKEVAAKLGVSEQTVANYKFEFLAKLRATVRSQGLSEDVFPELYQ
jgi:RNA polymerase sigma-70 factor, ECF subfamily